MLKIFISELSHGGLKFGVAIILTLLPALFFSGDFLTSKEKEGLVNARMIVDSVKPMSVSEVVESIGSAYAYGNLCDMEEEAFNVSKALTEKNLTFTDFKEGGRFRVDFLRGAERVAALFRADKQNQYRDITCGLGYAAFGPQGTIIPKLLKE